MENKSLVVDDRGRALVAPERESPPSVLEIIQQVARDPQVDVAKLQALLEIQLQIQDREAKIAFTEAFARMQPTLPRIKKNGKIDMREKGSMSFARWEDIDTAIRPILTAHGFTLSFTQKGSSRGVCMVAHLKHCQGHEETSEMELPPDTGAGRNALQAHGSTQSYCERYLTRGILNLVWEGVDKDGQSFGWITAQQSDTIMGLLEKNGANSNPKVQSEFLKAMGAKTVGEIHATDFKKAINILEGRYRELEERRAQLPDLDVLPDPTPLKPGRVMKCRGLLYETYQDGEWVKWKERK